MKKITFLSVLFFFLNALPLLSITYTWNGSVSTAWNTAANWTPSGVPAASDAVIIVTSANACTLPSNITITDLTLTSGNLNLAGFTLNVTGIGTCNGGITNSGTLNYTGATLTFAGTTFNSVITANVGDVYFNGSTFNQALTVIKTSANNIQSTGNNVYNGVTSITNAGTGYLLLTNNVSKTEVFNAALTLNTTNTGNLFVAYAGSMTLGANSVVNNTASTGNIYLGNGASSAVNLNPGITLTTGVFAGANLYITKFNQVAGTPQNLAPGVNGGVQFLSCIVNSPITVTAGNIWTQNSTFNSTANFNKNGGAANSSIGGNTFNGILTMNHSGSGYWGFGNGSPDIFNADLYLNNTCNSERIIIGQNSSNNQFNGNVYLSQSGSAQGTDLGFGGTFPVCQFATGRSVFINGTYNTGYLRLYRCSQASATPINLTTSGTTNVYLSGNVFTGPVNINSPDITPLGGTYNAPVVFTKTGTGADHNNGNLNIFNSTLTINNQGSAGFFLLGYNSADQFNDNVVVTSTGAGGISLGWTAGTGSPTLAAGKTISIGGAGFSAGYLQLGSFTQLGSAPITLTMTGTASFLVVKSSVPCVFGGTVDVTAPDIYVRGGTFNGPALFTKTGGVSNHNNTVQNIFNSTCTINQQSNTGYFMLGYNSNDLFNDDITVTSTGTGGIYLGWVNLLGTPTLASGKTILVGGAGFSAGSLYLNHFTQLGSAPINLNFTGSTTSLFFAYNSVIGGNLNIVTPNIAFNGATFNGSIDCIKTGNNSDYNQGGNIFNGISSFTNTSAGYWVFGGNNPDIFNSDSYFTTSGTERISPAWNSAGNQFNGNITVNSIGGAVGVQFCGGTTASATLAAGKTLQIGTAGFNSGYLIIPRFTQLGSAPITLSLSPTATYLQYGPGSALGGSVTSISPGLYFNGCTFSGVTTCTKTGTTNDASIGNNIFNNTTTLTNAGSGYLLLGSGNMDQFNAASTFNNIGSSNIYVAYNSSNNVFGGVATFSNSPTANTLIYVSPYSSGTLFNDNIVVTSTNGQGVQFCGGNSTASATLAATKTINVGSGGFSSGTLLLKQFTQVGPTPQSITTTGTSILTYGPSSSFGGNVTSVSPSLYFHGCTYNGVVNCTKNGSTNDQSNGSNIFNNTTTLTNSGSGYLLFGNAGNDQFNTTTTFNNIGSSHIYVSFNSTGNVFGGPVTFNNSPTSTGSWIYVASYQANNSLFNDNISVNNVNGGGVYFGVGGTGTSTLSAGKTISVNGSGFNAGGLVLRNFTQVGGTAQTLTTTGTSYIQYGPSSSFAGNVSSTSPGLLFHGCTYNGVTTCTKTGTTNDASNGGNIFNNTTTMTNIGSGYLLFGNGTNDQFNATSTFNNLGSSHIYVAQNSTGNVFGGPVTLNNSPTSTNSWIYMASTSPNNSVFNDNISVNNVNGAGIYFGSGTGTSTLIAGKTISVNGSGFNAGGLILKNFTQLGSTPQTLTTTGTSYIQYGPSSSFSGNLSSTSPGLLFNTSTFAGVTTCTKTGTSNDASPGGNSFNGATTAIINNGTGNLFMANGTPDVYNTNISFVQNNTGVVYPNYAANCTYAGDISVTSPAAAPITFGANTGTATINGVATQSMNKTAGTPNPIFTRLVMNKTSNAFTLNTRINVSLFLTLTSGTINTTSTNILNMNNSSTTTIGNAASYVNGPMNYDMAFTGLRTLYFPIGKVSDWRPAILTVNHSNATSYTYNSELFNASASALGWSLPPTLTNVSTTHYWDINRTLTNGANTPTAGLSGTQTVTLFYDANDGVTFPSSLRIAKNTYTALTSWIDIGGAGSAVTTGSITSSSAPSLFNSFSRFTLASIDGVNPLPMELVKFTATPNINKVDLEWVTASEHNTDYFDVERSADGINFNYLTTVKAHGNSNSTQQYYSVDEKPLNGVSYYRLKQVDKTKESKYTNAVMVEFVGNSFVNVYPNPTTDKLNIKTSNDYHNATVRVLSSVGAVVMDSKQLVSYNGTIDLSSLANGIYFVVIDNGLSIEKIKISLQK